MSKDLWICWKKDKISLYCMIMLVGFLLQVQQQQLLFCAFVIIYTSIDRQYSDQCVFRKKAHYDYMHRIMIYHESSENGNVTKETKTTNARKCEHRTQARNERADWRECNRGSMFTAPNVKRLSIACIKHKSVSHSTQSQSLPLSIHKTYIYRRS